MCASFPAEIFHVLVVADTQVSDGSSDVVWALGLFSNDNSVEGDKTMEKRQ